MGPGSGGSRGGSLVGTPQPTPQATPKLGPIPEGGEGSGDWAAMKRGVREVVRSIDVDRDVEGGVPTPNALNQKSHGYTCCVGCLQVGQPGGIDAIGGAPKQMQAPSWNIN